MPIQILRLLKEKDGFVSGEGLSAELGITRAGVWKQIRILREQGFEIEAVPSRGYRLVKSPDLSAEDILVQVQGDFWKDVLFYPSVNSTNELASALSATGEIASGTVIIADMQESGKGRLGRRWISPPGLNIYMSIVMKPEIRPQDATLLTVIAALASAGAVSKEGGLDVRIKWPNDLMASGKKLGGILTEVRSDPDRVTLAIVGIGINVNMKAAAFPGEIRTIATSIRHETGRLHQRSGIIAGVLKGFERWYTTLLKHGRNPLLEEWKRLSSTLGRNVRVAIGNETLAGLAEDIDDEGMLILRLPSGLRKRISAGDVTELR